MKKYSRAILCVSISVFVIFNSKGQTSTSRFGVHVWKDAVLLYPCDIKGNLTQGAPPILSQRNQRIEVFSEIPATSVASGRGISNASTQEARVVLRIIPYKTKAADAPRQTKAQALNSKYVTGDIAALQATGIVGFSTLSPTGAVATQPLTSTDLYFSVPNSIFDAKTSPFSVIGGGFAVGTLNYPFKYRPQLGKADFGSAFNFGATLGYTIKHNSLRRFLWSTMVGFSASNILVEPGAAQKNADLLKDGANTFGGFSFSMGVLAQQEKIQVGLFLGWDRLGYTTHSKYEWIYQGRPWISIGWGLSIFTPQKEKTSDIETQ